MGLFGSYREAIARLSELRTALYAQAVSADAPPALRKRIGWQIEGLEKAIELLASDDDKARIEFEEEHASNRGSGTRADRS